MSEREDERILALLYEEVPGSSTSGPLSPEAEDDLAAYRSVLARVREVPDDEPSPHLDALILAHAREVAEKSAEDHRAWWRRLLSNRGFSLALAATATVFVAVLVVPQMRDEAPSDQSIPVTPTAAPKLAMAPQGVSTPPAEGLARVEPSAVAEAPAEAEPGLVEEAEKNEVPARESLNETRRRSRGALREADARDPAPLAKKPSADRFDEIAGAKGDGAAAPGPSTVGTLGGSASGATGADKDRAQRDEVAELDDVLSRAKSKKESESREESKAASSFGEDEEARPASRPPPAPSPTITSAAPGKPADEPEAEPAEVVAPDPSPRQQPAKRAASPSASGGGASANASADSAEVSGASSSITSIRSEARRLEMARDVDGARRYLLTTRRRYVGTPMYEQVSFELAELELRQRRYPAAEAYARDVLTTKDASLAERARQLIRVAQAAAR